MELLKVVKENDIIKVVFKVGESDMPEQNGLKPKAINVNEIVFSDKQECIDYFSAVSEHNKQVIINNEQRLEQIDENSLEKINEFVEVIKKTKALGSKKCKKIDELIAAHESMRSFQYNIKLTKERNKINEQILEEVSKLE